MEQIRPSSGGKLTYSQHLGDIWRSTDWKRRKPYQAIATELTNEHKRLYPDYMFKPRQRKKSDAVKSSTGRGSNGALKMTPVGPPKVGRSSEVSKTLQKTPKTQNDTHMWSNDLSPS